MVQIASCFYNGLCLLELISEDFETDNRSVHFRPSEVFILNLADLKYKTNVHNRLFAYENKT